MVALALQRDAGATVGMLAVWQRVGDMTHARDTSAEDSKYVLRRATNEIMKIPGSPLGKPSYFSEYER